MFSKFNLQISEKPQPCETMGEFLCRIIDNHQHVYLYPIEYVINAAIRTFNQFMDEQSKKENNPNPDKQKFKNLFYKKTHGYNLSDDEQSEFDELSKRFNKQDIITIRLKICYGPHNNYTLIDCSDKEEALKYARYIVDYGLQKTDTFVNVNKNIRPEQINSIVFYSIE